MSAQDATVWTAPVDHMSMGDLGRAIGSFTESEGGDSDETTQARRVLFDIYESWVALGRPEHDVFVR